MGGLSSYALMKIQKSFRLKGRKDASAVPPLFRDDQIKRDTLTDNGCSNRLVTSDSRATSAGTFQRTSQHMVPLSVWVHRLLFPFTIIHDIQTI